MIHRIFWKILVKVDSVIISEDQPLDFEIDDFWVLNDLCSLKNASKNILMSKEALFNNRIMDTAQKFMSRALGADSDYQLVLTLQKKCKLPFCPVTQARIHLLHDGCNHWLLNFFFK